MSSHLVTPKLLSVGGRGDRGPTGCREPSDTSPIVNRAGVGFSNGLDRLSSPDLLILPANG
jgi:hypothetical protein